MYIPKQKKTQDWEPLKCRRMNDVRSSLSPNAVDCVSSDRELDLKEVENNGEVEEAVKNCPVFSISSLFPLLVLRVIYPCIETITQTHFYWD